MKTKLLMLSTVFALLFFACKEEKAETLSASPDKIEVGSDGGSKTFNIASNMDWTITVDAAATWCTVSPLSGNGDKTITVTISSNQSQNPRTATLTVTSGAITAKITVEQAKFEKVDDNVVITASSDTVCYNTPVTLTGPVTIGGLPVTSYKWSADGAEIAGATAATYTSEGLASAVSYTLAISNSAGYEYTSDPKVIGVYDEFNPGELYPAKFGPFCPGYAFNAFPPLSALSATTGGDGNYTYQWYKNDVEITGATGQNYILTTADGDTPGTFVYTRKVRDGACQSSFVVTGNADTIIIRSPSAPGSTLTFADFCPSNAPAGSTWTLQDDREPEARRNSYNVKLMDDNKYWMVSDLKYGGTGATNACAKTTFSGSTSTESEKSNRFGGNTYGDCKNVGMGGGSVYAYDWAAAMQTGKAFYGSDQDPEGMYNQMGMKIQGLCPKGWKLPSKADYTALGNALGNTPAGWSKWSPGFTIPCDNQGNMDMTGMGGPYWSTTKKDDNNAYMLHADTGSVQVEASSPKHYGRLIRCVKE